jgi:hypothetical protein
VQEEKKKKFPLNAIEVVLLVVAFPVVFYFLLKILCEPMNKHAPYWFSKFWGILLILGFDFIWLLVMKLWPLKILRVKIYITLIVFVISSAILACWTILNLLSGIW